MAAWQQAAALFFTDIAALKELFVTRSGLLQYCDESALEAIKRRWDDEIFAAVYKN